MRWSHLKQVILVLGCTSRVWAQEGPPALKVMVPTVTMPPAVASQFTLEPGQVSTLLAQAVRQMAGQPVVTQEDLKALLEQTSRTQLLGCDEMACGLDLARAAQADLLLRGEVGLVGERLLVSLTLIHVQDARVMNIVSRHLHQDQLAAGALQPMVGRLFNRATTQALEEALPPPSAEAAPAGKPERLLVTHGAWSPAVGDAGAVRGALSRVAEVIARQNRYDIISVDELATVVTTEADRQLLGEGNPEMLAQVSQALHARWVVSVGAGKTGDVTVVSAAFLDAQVTSVVARSSVVFRDAAQTMDAVDVATRKLFGESAVLPPPHADPNAVEARLKVVATGVEQAYQKLPQGGAAGLVILPFGEDASEPRARHLGTQLATFLDHLLGAQSPATLAPEDKLRALFGREVPNPLLLSTAQVQEAGMFLGAQALVLGSVGDLGTDYLVQVRLVKVSTAEVLHAAHLMVPKAKPGKLLPTRVVVTRSRADALTRAVVPGLAQFTGGTVGLVKGAVFVGLMGAAAVVLAGGLLGAALGGFYYAVNTTSMPTFLDPVTYGSCFETEKDSSTALSPDCNRGRLIGAGLVAAFGALAVLGLATGVGAYLASFVDAALYGQREEELSFETTK